MWVWLGIIIYGISLFSNKIKKSWILIPYSLIYAIYSVALFQPFQSFYSKIGYSNILLRDLFLIGTFLFLTLSLISALFIFTEGAKGKVRVSKDIKNKVKQITFIIYIILLVTYNLI
jgi:hypothetical protein